MIKIIVVAVIIVLILPLSIDRSTHWRGEVFDSATGSWVEGVTVTLLAGDNVVDVATSDSDGEFKVKTGYKRDSTHRIVMCKSGFEPGISSIRPRGGRRGRGTSVGRYGLFPANPNFVAPEISKILAVLPASCR